MTPPRKPSRRRPALVAVLLSAALASATPNAARAAEEEVEHYDARVQGYSPVVESKSSSVTMVWVLAVVLGGGCLGVMFMNPRRSHLD